MSWMWAVAHRLQEDGFIVPDSLQGLPVPGRTQHTDCIDETIIRLRTDPPLADLHWAPRDSGRFAQWPGMNFLAKLAIAQYRLCAWLK